MLDLLITVLILLLVFAVFSYIVNTYIPLDPPLKHLVLLIVGVILLIWILLLLMGHAPGFLPLRR